jgi:hypothetical protein
MEYPQILDQIFASEKRSSLFYHQDNDGEKSFIGLKPEGNVTKLFTAVSYNFL